MISSGTVKVLVWSLILGVATSFQLAPNLDTVDAYATRASLASGLASVMTPELERGDANKTAEVSPAAKEAERPPSASAGSDGISDSKVAGAGTSEAEVAESPLTGIAEDISPLEQFRESQKAQRKRLSDAEVAARQGSEEAARKEAEFQSFLATPPKEPPTAEPKKAVIKIEQLQSTDGTPLVLLPAKSFLACEEYADGRYAVLGTLSKTLYVGGPGRLSRIVSLAGNDPGILREYKPNEMWLPEGLKGPEQVTRDLALIVGAATRNKGGGPIYFYRGSAKDWVRHVSFFSSGEIIDARTERWVNLAYRNMFDTNVVHTGDSTAAAAIVGDAGSGEARIAYTFVAEENDDVPTKYGLRIALDTANGREQSIGLQYEEGVRIRKLNFSPNGRYLAYEFDDGAIAIWGIREKKRIHYIAGELRGEWAASETMRADELWDSRLPFDPQSRNFLIVGPTEYNGYSFKDDKRWFGTRSADGTYASVDFFDGGDSVYFVSSNRGLVYIQDILQVNSGEANVDLKALKLGGLSSLCRNVTLGYHGGKYVTAVIRHPDKRSLISPRVLVWDLRDLSKARVIPNVVRNWKSGLGDLVMRGKFVKLIANGSEPWWVRFRNKNGDAKDIPLAVLSHKDADAAFVLHSIYGEVSP